MSTRHSVGLMNNMLAALKTDLDGGFLFVWAGPVPATPDEALDTATLHTQLVKMSVNGDGSTGLTFEAPAAGVLAKESTEVWKGPVAFDGVSSGASSLVPTFWRFCQAGDAGRTAATTQGRLQGRCGPGQELVFVDPNFVPGGGNERGASIFNYGLGE